MIMPKKVGSKRSRPTKPTARTEVDSTRSLTKGQPAIVLLRDWMPASEMSALRTELRIATGCEPVILPPGATLKPSEFASV